MQRSPVLLHAAVTLTADGEWRAATLPAIEHPTLAAHVPGQPRWQAYGLVWGAGAVWATLLDRGFRTAVLTTQPGSTPVIVLPSKEQADADRAPLPQIFEEIDE